MGGASRSGRVRVDPARDAAYDVLKAVRTQDAYANLVLPQVLRKHGLAGRDAAFATELAAGTIRHQGSYDPIIDACLTKPRLEAKVRDALRLGVHQLLAMRVPDHAAISTTVDLVRGRIGPGPTGLVNAVLRKVAARDLDAWLAEVATGAPADRLAVVHSHPRWVVDALGEALSGSVSVESRTDSTLTVESRTDSTLTVESRTDSTLTVESRTDSTLTAESRADSTLTAESRADSVASAGLEALLAADNESPPVTLVARPGRSRVDELPGERTRFSPYGAVLDGGDPAAVPAVAEGRAGVQDEGSQLVAVALATAHLDGPDERWLDLCAGPGGKAALLAALAAQRGARVVANESQPHRAELVRRSLGVSAGDGVLAAAGIVPGVEEVVCADGRAGPWAPGSFDRVLVDAPCTGLGALRRRPEVRWRRRPADLDTLVPLQLELFAAALDAVRPGGLVLYSTCSPVLAETRDVVDATLAARPEARLEPLRWEIPDAEGPLPGTVQLWPHRHGTDAMFLALLRRTG